MSKNQENEYIEKRFPGMDAHEIAYNYWGMNRVSKNEETIIIRINGENLLKTTYGFALPIASDTVIFLKEFQIHTNQEEKETNIILKKEYFKTSKWGNHPDFEEMGPEKESWNYWLQVAKDQQARDEEEGRICKIRKTGKEQRFKHFSKKYKK